MNAAGSRTITVALLCALSAGCGRTVDGSRKHPVSGGEADAGTDASGSASTDGGTAPAHPPREAGVIVGAPETGGPVWTPLLPATVATARPERVDDCDFGELQDRTAVLYDGAAGFLVVDQDSVYFVDQKWTDCNRSGCPTNPGSSLYRVPRCGGARETVLEGPEKFETFIDGGRHLYWSHDKELVRFDKETRSVKRFPNMCITSLASNADALFFDDQCDPGVLRLAHGSDAPERIISGEAPLRGPLANYMGPPTAGSPRLVANSAHLFWIDFDSAVRWLELDTGNRGGLGPIPFMPDSLAVDHNALIVQRQASPLITGNVVRVPLDGSRVTDLGAERSSLAVLESPHVFWTTWSVPTNRTSLFRGRTDDPTASTELATRSIWAVAAYGKRLYWSGAGVILTAVHEPLRVEAPADDTLPTIERTFGSSNGSEAFEVSGFTADGSLVAAGAISPNATFDGTPPSQALGDIVSKWSPSGSLLWQRILGDGTANSFLDCMAVTANGSFVTRSPENGTNIPEIAFLDTDGTVRWEHAEQLDTPYTCAATKDGSLLLGRSIEPVGTAPGERVLHVIAENGVDSHVIPLAKSDATGGIDVSQLSVASDGTVYVGGSLGGSVMVGSHQLVGDDPGAPPLNSAFILQITPAEQIGFALAIRGSDIRGVAAMPGGGVAVTGMGENLVELGGHTYTMAFPGGLSVWIARLDAGGAVIWLRSFPGSFFGSTSASSLIATPARELLLMAEQWTDATYLAELSTSGPGTPGTYLQNPFLARFDETGQLIHTREFKNANTVNLHLHTDAPGTAWVVGQTKVGRFDAYVAGFGR